MRTDPWCGVDVFGTVGCRGLLLGRCQHVRLGNRQRCRTCLNVGLMGRKADRVVPGQIRDIPHDDQLRTRHLEQREGPAVAGFPLRRRHEEISGHVLEAGARHDNHGRMCRANCRDGGRSESVARVVRAMGSHRIEREVRSWTGGKVEDPDLPARALCGVSESGQPHAGVRVPKDVQEAGSCGVPVGAFPKVKCIDANMWRRVLRGAVTVVQDLDVVQVRQLRCQIRRYMGDGLRRVESFTHLICRRNRLVAAGVRSARQQTRCNETTRQNHRKECQLPEPPARLHPRPGHVSLNLSVRGALHL